MTGPNTAVLSWPAAWRLARRDLSLRFRGLRLLLACLFLGVAALAAIGSLTGSIERELTSRGRAILGGDIGLEVWQRDLTPTERAALEAMGRVSVGTRLQAMATAGDLAAPVQLKGVDETWPLVGRLRLADGREVGAPPPGQAWLAEGAAERLGLSPGQGFMIAGQRLIVGGALLICRHPVCSSTQANGAHRVTEFGHDAGHGHHPCLALFPLRQGFVIGFPEEARLCWQ